MKITLEYTNNNTQIIARNEADESQYDIYTLKDGEWVLTYDDLSPTGVDYEAQFNEFIK